MPSCNRLVNVFDPDLQNISLLALCVIPEGIRRLWTPSLVLTLPVSLSPSSRHIRPPLSTFPFVSLASATTIIVPIGRTSASTLRDTRATRDGHRKTHRTMSDVGPTRKTRRTSVSFSTLDRAKANVNLTSQPEQANASKPSRISHTQGN